MKRTLFIILFLLPFTLFGQDLIPIHQLPKDSTTNQVTYKQIQEPGVSAIDIYNPSREWFVTTLRCEDISYLPASRSAYSAGWTEPSGYGQ